MLRWTVAAALILACVPEARADDLSIDECDVVEREIEDDELALASIDLARCAAQDPTEAARLAPRIAKDAAALGYSPVEVVTEPAGQYVIASLAPKRAFAAPHKIWLPPGNHELFLIDDDLQAIASSLVVVKDGNRASVLLRRPADAPPPRTSEVDFTDEAAGEMQTGSPEDVEFDSLLPERYRQALGNRRAEDDGGAATGGAIAYRVAMGLALTRSGGTNSPGVMLSGRAAFRASRIRVAPELAATFAKREDTTFAQAHGAVLIELGFVRDGRGPVFALGPGATWITGDGALEGSALGGVAVIELVQGFGSLLLRGELPVTSSAEVSTATFAFSFGLHW